MTVPAGVVPPVRRWSLQARLLMALAAALVPLGIVAAVLTIAICNSIIGERTATAETVLSLTRVQIVAVVFPLIGWLAALATIGLTVHRHVVAPLGQLQRLVDALGRGEAGSAVLAASPLFSTREMQAMGDSILRMARDIETQSHVLGASIAEQQRLTREVHHRVKNSLQIISSLLSLHARGQSTAAIAQAYAAMHARVGALNMVHRWIDDEDGKRGVHLPALLGDLAGVIESTLFESSHGAVATDAVATLDVSAKVAVPIAFIVTELASIAASQVGEDAVQMAIGAQRSGETVNISMVSSGFAGNDWLHDHPGAPSTGIINGMVRQLGGVLDHAGEGDTYAVRFDDRAA